MTTKEDIKVWLNRAKPEHTHMIVVCDGFDYEDYPVYVEENEDIREIEKKYNGINMQKIMEVYNLKIDIESQLNENRAFNY